MPKHWREASSLILASRINFRSILGSSRYTDMNYSNESVKRVSRKNPDYTVLFMRRSVKSSFMPGVYVFPGGTTVPSDSNEGWKELFNDSGYTASNFRHLPPLAPIFHDAENSRIAKAISLRITAIRETFEECGILLCRNKLIQNESKPWASFLSGGEVLEWQKKVQQNPSELLNLYKTFECVPDIWALHLWSNWLTPVTYPKRFDTVFFIALLDQAPPTSIDNTEVDEMKWCTTSDIIQDKYKLPPPQLYEVSRLNNFGTLDHLAEFTVERAKLGCERWMSVQVKTSDGVVGFLPGDDMYPSSPELYERTSLKQYKEKMEDLRIKSTRLHRWESNGKYINRIFASNIEPGYGHVLPVTDE
ncbi:acyl-coenzyme A diphosphatase NUDT19 isoform X2 [Anabrus simplex]|uniref:acyl-coenzyme A diphosphatase NUDT19 isoform X2 n=1 Tax=Anabrus simplex TaxID=316456 RepID=UPI0035A29519